MKTKPSPAKVVPPSRISVAWPPFAKRLAEVLAKLKEDQFLVVSLKDSNRFVQFAAQGAFGMRAETTSNNYLTKQEQLDSRQIAALVELGWLDPTGAPSESTPDKDPDGSPNFFCEFGHPVQFENLANLTVRTLTEVIRVPHPGRLEYAAYDTENNEIELPELGLRVAKRAPSSRGLAGLSRKLLATIKKMAGISDLAFDDDGDIGLRYGSALTFVRLIGDPSHVRFYSPILSGIEDSPALFERLNDFNVNTSAMRFVFQNGIIYGVADIAAVPFVTAHVSQAFDRFCAVVDGMDSLLQEEFGGRTAFAESMPSTARH